MTETIIFDLGGVLIDWSPSYVFDTIFEDEKEKEYFFQNICTSEWNEQQDAGRSIAEGNAILIEQFPHYKEPILAFYGRWKEMLGGPIDETVQLLKELKDLKQHNLYALTNWSAETFPVAIERYEFLQWFEGILVSGEEKMKKPDPRIYQLMLDRYNIEPASALFIDDSKKNVDSANEFGLPAVLFESVDKLRE